MIRWHFTTEKAHYNKMLASFITSYLATTFRKKRSLLLHFRNINFDFSRYVDLAFKTMTFYFLPLTAAIDLTLMFITEGVKIIYRYTYGILKYQKDFIKAEENEEKLI